jgi:hypothetical protein
VSKAVTNWPVHAIPQQAVPYQALNAASGFYSSSPTRIEGFSMDIDFDRAALSAETRAIHRDVAEVSFRSLPD